MRLRLHILAGLVLGSLALTLVAEEHSKLWPAADAALRDRLPDFSFAGYQRGEKAIPEVAVTANVRDFGAKGDGVTDDTAAFKAAIEKTAAGAILIPEGRYLLTDILDIRKPNIVLRGVGPTKTTLFFTKELEEVRTNMGATTAGRPTSNYSWSGGFVWARGSYGSKDLATITQPARRGAMMVAVSTTDGLAIGQTIEIEQRDEPTNTLAAHLYAGQPDDTAKLLGKTHASLTARITAMDAAAKTIRIDRALRFDIESRWTPKVLRFEPTVTGVGIESLRFEFPQTPYMGHFTERGRNAIAFTQVADCWVRDVAIDDCDSGIFARGRYCTFSDIVLRSGRTPDAALKCTGHHGFEFDDDDNLLTRFRFETRFVHDICVCRCAGNVTSSGFGVDLCLDHHKYAPYANLFTDLDAGAGTRLWRCGGGAKLGKHSGADETFWNIRAAKAQSWPPKDFGPDRMNLVGLTTDQPAEMSAEGKWFEPISPKELSPQNLHAGQVEKRVGKKAGER